MYCFKLVKLELHFQASFSLYILARVARKRNLEGKHEAAAIAHRSILVRWVDRQLQICQPSLLVLVLFYSVSCSSSHQLPLWAHVAWGPHQRPDYIPTESRPHGSELPSPQVFLSSPPLVIGHAWLFRLCGHLPDLPTFPAFLFSSFSHSCMRSANYDTSLIPELHELMVRVFLTPSSAELQSSS